MKIQPCLYCGGSAILIAPNGDDANGPWCVQCECCYANGPCRGIFEGWSEEMVVLAWNGVSRDGGE